MYIKHPPTKSISELVKRMKGRTSRLSRIEEKILGEIPLGNRIWGKEI
jgi:REP element-mobilizing transposase RayT